MKWEIPPRPGGSCLEPVPIHTPIATEEGVTLDELARRVGTDAALSQRCAEALLTYESYWFRDTKPFDSLRELLAETRREQACLMLRNRHLSVSEVAHSIGFAEVSSFTRAFKRWMGCSPSEWRGQAR